MSHHPPSAPSIADNLRQVRARIEQACARAGRSPDEVRLLLATKTVPAERIEEALAAGCTLLGENRVQEAGPKAEALSGRGIEWHMIGHLQSNKVRQTLEWADVIESVDRPSLLKALRRELARRERTLDVYLQVNTSGEETKYGVAPEEAEAFAQRIVETPGLRLRGLMTIALHASEPEGARPCFRLLRGLRDKIQPAVEPPLELSMGMSGDLEVAVEEGATVVRVGTAVFGDRGRPDSHYWPSR